MEVSTNSNNVLSSVFFQKQSWQNMYARYPDLVLIDATYKLNNLHLMDIFVKHIDTTNTKCIMADKDMTEREVLAEKFLNVALTLKDPKATVVALT